MSPDIEVKSRIAILRMHVTRDVVSTVNYDQLDFDARTM